MSPEELRARFEQSIEEMFHQRNLDAMEKYYAPNFVIHRPWGSEDFEECKQGLAKALAAFPDFHYTVEDFLVLGDTDVCRYRVRATSATGKTVDTWGIEIDRWENGKFVEMWSSYDRPSLMGLPLVTPAAPTT